MKTNTRGVIRLGGRLGMSLLASMLLMGCIEKPEPVPRGTAAIANACAETTFEGFPRIEPAMPRTHFVCHNGFALEYAEMLRSALWVTQRLQAEDLDERTASREREEFRPDGFMPEGVTPDPSRFTRSGFDRGHLAPADDFRENQIGMSHSFYTSNIVPQDPGHNRGIWLRLEENVRTWAQEKGTVYVITGPIYFADNRPYTPAGRLSLSDGRNEYVIEEYNSPEDRRRQERQRAQGIAVPTHLYKIVYDPQQQQAVAFVIPNVDLPAQDLPRYATTVAAVEQLTRLRFFPELPMEEQARIKTNVLPSAWVVR